MEVRKWSALVETIGRIDAVTMIPMEIIRGVSWLVVAARCGNVVTKFTMYERMTVLTFSFEILRPRITIWQSTCYIQRASIAAAFVRGT